MKMGTEDKKLKARKDDNVDPSWAGYDITPGRFKLEMSLTAGRTWLARKSYDSKKALIDDWVFIESEITNPFRKTAKFRIAEYHYRLELHDAVQFGNVANFTPTPSSTTNKK